MTTKTHALVDGNGLPLVIAVTPGQANDSPALPKLLAELRVPRQGPGRPRTTPLALRADKAYSARAHRGHLRSRGITAVIPEQSDQIRNRKNRGSRGGRPVSFDAHDYKNRNVVERAFNHFDLISEQDAESWPYCSQCETRIGTHSSASTLAEIAGSFSKRWTSPNLWADLTAE